MPRRRLLCLPAVIAAVVVASASAQDPLGERVRLTKADNALASRISLRASDLASGWQPRPSVSSGPGGGDRCPGYSPDFSSITITGHQQRSFRLPNHVLQADSLVEVYATLDQARKDWKLSMTGAAAKCWGSKLAGKEMSLSSARLLAGPPFGDASAKFAWVMNVQTPSGRVPVHVDLLVVLRGRVIVGLFTTAALRSAPGQQSVLARMVSRMDKQSA